MRVCVVGGGIAGTLLAWRLAAHPGVGRVVLAPGPPPGGTAAPARDATAASGGVVRAFEPDTDQRRLCTESLAELLGSPLLRGWGGYTCTGFAYVRADRGGLAAAAAEIDAAVPGSVELVPGDELARRGWAGLPPGSVALWERRAGRVALGRLRDAIAADLAGLRRATVLPAGRVSDVGPGRCSVGGRTVESDAVVLATGAWTPELLRSAGYPAEGYRTKAVQYTVHRASGPRPPAFLDESTGLYGTPVDDGMLLGLPTEAWGESSVAGPASAPLEAAAARLARTRFPGLRLGPAGTAVRAADCYRDPPRLALRPVADTDGRLLTFTGGSGGAAKTALAASRRAATQLADAHRCRTPRPPSSTGRRHDRS